MFRYFGELLELCSSSVVLSLLFALDAVGVSLTLPLYLRCCVQKRVLCLQVIEKEDKKLVRSL